MTGNSVPRYSLVITFDYEVSISDDFDVRRDMIRPTWKLLEVCEGYGAKVTIMAEIAEIWAYETEILGGSRKRLGYDPSLEIRNQLIEVVKRGHDVQLHLHPQWLGAKWARNSWQLNYFKYRLTDLEYHEMATVFRCGKEYLENLLRPYCNSYSCIGFRAGNWITQPSSKYLRALHEAGLKSDTSVFKGGYTLSPSVFFDYRNAYSNILPWFADWDDINRPGKGKGILEIPIYAEPVRIFSLLTLRRLRKAAIYYFEDRRIRWEARAIHSDEPKSLSVFREKFVKIFGLYPKKMDFCKLTASEMSAMLKNLVSLYFRKDYPIPIPVVMIGHSKEMDSCSELARFLKKIHQNYRGLVQFKTYSEMIKEYQFNAEKIINTHASKV